MDQELGIFDAEGQADEQPAVEVQPEPEQQPEVVAEGEPAAPPAEEQRNASHQVPLTAILDEREKRQKAEAEAAQYRQELERIRQQQQPQQKPDFFENPEAILEQRLMNERMNMSELIARKDYGVETVNAARDAFIAAAQRNPAMQAEIARHPHPYDFVVGWHRQQSALAEIGDDPKAYRERIRQEILAEMQAQPSAPTAPPASLAAAPSAGKPANMPTVNAPAPLRALFG